MKRVIAGILALSLVFSLGACGTSDSQNTSSVATSSVVESESDDSGIWAKTSTQTVGALSFYTPAGCEENPVTLSSGSEGSVFTKDDFSLFTASAWVFDIQSSEFVDSAKDYIPQLIEGSGFTLNDVSSTIILGMPAVNFTAEKDGEKGAGCALIDDSNGDPAVYVFIVQNGDSTEDSFVKFQNSFVYTGLTGSGSDDDADGDSSLTGNDVVDSSTTIPFGEKYTLDDGTEISEFDMTCTIPRGLISSGTDEQIRLYMSVDRDLAITIGSLDADDETRTELFDLFKDKDYKPSEEDFNDVSKSIESKGFNGTMKYSGYSFSRNGDNARLALMYDATLDVESSFSGKGTFMWIADTASNKAYYTMVLTNASAEDQYEFCQKFLNKVKFEK